MAAFLISSLMGKNSINENSIRICWFASRTRLRVLDNFFNGKEFVIILFPNRDVPVLALPIKVKILLNMFACTMLGFEFDDT